MVLSIYGRSYLIYLIIAIHKLVQTLLGKVLNCVLKLKSVNFSLEKPPQPQNSKKSLHCNFLIR